MKNKFLIIVLCALIFTVGIKTNINANKNFNYIVKNNNGINTITDIFT